MLTCILAACVGLAMDRWEYAKCEAKPGVARPATVASAHVSGNFVGRSVAKFVERSPVAPAPAPAPSPKPQTPAQPQPVPMKPAAKAKCRRCGMFCGCGDACACDAQEAQQPVVQKQWYVMPENTSMEVYGYVDAANVIRYDLMRPRGAPVPYVVPIQAPMQMPRTFTMGACLPFGGGS